MNLLLAIFHLSLILQFHVNRRSIPAISTNRLNENLLGVKHVDFTWIGKIRSSKIEVFFASIYFKFSPFNKVNFQITGQNIL